MSNVYQSDDKKLSLLFELQMLSSCLNPTDLKNITLDFEKESVKQLETKVNFYRDLASINKARINPVQESKVKAKLYTAYIHYQTEVNPIETERALLKGKFNRRWYNHVIPGLLFFCVALSLPVVPFLFFKGLILILSFVGGLAAAILPVIIGGALCGAVSYNDERHKEQDIPLLQAQEQVIKKYLANVSGIVTGVVVDIITNVGFRSEPQSSYKPIFYPIAPIQASGIEGSVVMIPAEAEDPECEPGCGRPFAHYQA